MSSPKTKPNNIKQLYMFPHSIVRTINANRILYIMDYLMFKRRYPLHYLPINAASLHIHAVKNIKYIEPLPIFFLFTLLNTSMPGIYEFESKCIEHSAHTHAPNIPYHMLTIDITIVYIYHTYMEAFSRSCSFCSRTPLSAYKNNRIY